MSDAKARPRTGRPSPRENGPEGGARRGRPVGDHNAKRAELLAAVIEVIARDGYAGASMRRVAQHAGCTTGAVTYYFANKEEMVSAVAQNLFNQFDAMLETHREKLDIATVIKQWLQGFNRDESNGWIAWLQLLNHARHEPAFAGIIKHRYARFRQVFTTVLEEGQRLGTIRDDISADLLADQISAISDGWMMMWPIEPERFSAERVQALLDALMRLISPQQAAKRPGRAKAVAR